MSDTSNELGQPPDPDTPSSDQPDAQGNGELLFGTGRANRKGIGGATSHKNPNCACNACKARRREASAFALSDRAGEGPVEPTQAALGPAIDLVNIKPEPALDQQTQALIEADIVTYPVKNEPGAPRMHILSWVQLRAINPDITLAEAARRIGVGKKYLSGLISKASKEGWLRFNDPLSRLEFQIVPKTIDNLNFYLDAKDKQVTLETAKGTIFKQYQESKGITENHTTVLALKLEMPEDGEIKVVGGHVVGKPKISVEDVTGHETQS